jgi:hypothetical protein
VLAGAAYPHVSLTWLMTGTHEPGSWHLRATFPSGT